MRRMLAKRVDQDGDFRAFGVFEQQRGTAALDRAIGKPSDLQDGIHFEGNAFDLALLF